jgi:hypothetical protein
MIAPGSSSRRPNIGGRGWITDGRDDDENDDGGEDTGRSAGLSTPGRSRPLPGHARPGAPAAAKQLMTWHFSFVFRLVGSCRQRSANGTTVSIALRIVVRFSLRTASRGGAVGIPGSGGLLRVPAGPAPGRPTPPRGRLSAPQLPKAQQHKGALVGVVWGEGASGQPGPATGKGLSGWVERIIHTVWRRLFMHGGEA